MSETEESYLRKFITSLPWLSRYPFWRANELFRRLADGTGKMQHLIFLVANHFEPGWQPNGAELALSVQQQRLKDWSTKARRIASRAIDCNGQPFRHTYFYPAELYHRSLLTTLSDLEAEGLGEVEIHLHHGVERPDTAPNTRRVLLEFRDALAEEHKCLSRMNGEGPPMYGFVHGNLALANSFGGKYCGVDSEMQILAETGCYADFSLPSAPLESQVPRINSIYQCGHPLDEASPHRSGPSVRVGEQPRLPVIFTGPLVFNWTRRFHGFPVPRLDDGVLGANYPMNLARLERWAGAHISITGRRDWIFVKLYSHGFFPQDQDAMIGDSMSLFWDEVLNHSESSGDFKVYFTTAREAFNMLVAAVEGKEGEPGQYRDYRLRSIMKTNQRDRASRT